MTAVIPSPSEFFQRPSQDYLVQETVNMILISMHGARTKSHHEIVISVEELPFEILVPLKRAFKQQGWRIAEVQYLEEGELEELEEFIPTHWVMESHV